jgi:hypothetical protein
MVTRCVSFQEGIDFLSAFLPRTGLLGLVSKLQAVWTTLYVVFQWVCFSVCRPVIKCFFEKLCFVYVLWNIFLETLLPAIKKIKINVKQSHYRPGQALRVPEGWGSQILRQVVRLSDLLIGLLYLQELFLVLISVRGWVNPRAIVRPEGLYQWKILVTPSEIEPATFRLVAQCLNQLCHRVPPLLRKYLYLFIIITTNCNWVVTRWQ